VTRFNSTKTGVLWSASRCCTPNVPTWINAREASWGRSVPLTIELEVEDVNGGGVEPSDALIYTVDFERRGCDLNRDLVNAVLPLPQGLEFTGCVSGFAFACAYDPALHTVFIDHFRSGLAALEHQVLVEVQVAASPPTGRPLCAQAVGDGWEISSDPAVATPDAPTCVTVAGGGAALQFTKEIEEIGDGDGVIEHGEGAHFVLTVRNIGGAPVLDGHVIDALPVDLAGFDPALVTVTPASGVNLSAAAPGGLGSGVLEWDGLEILAGGEVTVEFDAMVLAAAGPVLCNQADLDSAAHGIAMASDDPSTVQTADTTCVPAVAPRFHAGSGILAGCDVATMSAGSTHSAVVKNDATIAIWGDNRNAQLGDGSRRDADHPVHLTSPTDVIDISGGRFHTAAVDATGQVWTWGDNSWGQLGHGSYADAVVPTPVAGLTDAVAVDAGGFHTLVLRGDGTVWSFGYNRAGQLGDGSNELSTVPVRVSGLNGVTASSATAHSTRLRPRSHHARRPVW